MLESVHPEEIREEVEEMLCEFLEGRGVKAFVSLQKCEDEEFEIYAHSDRLENLDRDTIRLLHDQ